MLRMTDPSWPADPDLGEAQIAWVRRHSPVLDTFVRQLLGDGALQGVRVAVVVHLEAKTAFLATVLADAGADVVVAGSNPRTTRAEVVAALAARGLRVVSSPGEDRDRWQRELLEAADTVPDYLVDDGAELTTLMARHRPELFARLRGVSEQTTTGTTRLRAMQRAGRLPFPALTANDARCKHLFDNGYGTGQTALQAVLRLTNRQLAGAAVAVVGYGFVGRGVARYARAMNARTMVAEIDPVRALEAHMDGHTVGPLARLLPEATIVITATGGINALAGRDIDSLRDGAVLANVGHHDREIDVDGLAARSDSWEELRPGIRSYRLGERRVHLLAGGALVNIAGGSGHPVEIMDLSFAVQGAGVHHLATTDVEPGVHKIPAELDDAIAAAKLASLGLAVDVRRQDQADDVADWLPGMCQP